MVIADRQADLLHNHDFRLATFVYRQSIVEVACFTGNSNNMVLAIKKILFSGAAGVVIAIGALTAVSCSMMGEIPSGQTLEKVKRSPQYNVKEGAFSNRLSKITSPIPTKITHSSTKDASLWQLLAGNGRPTVSLPTVKPDLVKFMEPSDDIKVIWFGHSTFLLNLSGTTILIDPVFSDYASPIPWLVKRFQPPALMLRELPTIDIVVISHDHYDHLDMKSVKFFSDKPTKFITPIGVGSYLLGWGIEADKITELDWWQHHKVGSTEFIATPAQHFSGRRGYNNNQTLWASWVFRNAQHNIYFSGDSGYADHFKEIGEKFGPFDIAFIENGQYNLNWRSVHLLPEETAQAYFDLKAKRLFPIHWGMFILSYHSWFEPIVKIDQEATRQGINLVAPKLGEVIAINDQLKLHRWWQSLITDDAKKDGTE